MLGFFKKTESNEIKLPKAKKQLACDSSTRTSKSKCSRPRASLFRRSKKAGASRARSSKKSSSQKHLLSKADPLAIKGTEKLGPNMMILADGLRLDKNTQLLLAYYDARTLDDFSCMTEDDFDALKLSAEALDRTLPPLQIRKVQILLEWVRNLCKKADTKTFGVTDTPLLVDNTNIIPNDWKRKFEDDLPDLKQALKERGEKSDFYANLLTNSYQSLLCMGCGQ